MYFPILSGNPNRTSEATIVVWTSGRSAGHVDTDPATNLGTRTRAAGL